MEKTVLVTQTVKVKIDETKFNESFMSEFRKYLYNFKTIDDHIKHLAQLHARGIYDNGDFIEGYGDEMGIEFKVEDTEIEIV